MVGPEAGRNVLTQLVLKPTVYCFHRCGYCRPRQDFYTDLVRNGRAQELSDSGAGRRRNPGHLPLEVALGAVEEAAGLGMRSLQLSGGDPLLYPHLLEVIRAGAACPGVFVFMNSVGTGVTQAKAKRIIEAGLGAWNFSVDTLDPELYDSLRGVRGAFEQVSAAIGVVQRAAADFPGFCVNYMVVVTRRSFRGLPDLVARCVDTGIASVHLMTVYGDTAGESLLGVGEIAQWREVTVPAVLEVLRSRDLPDVVVDNAEKVMGSFFSTDNADTNYAAGVYWPTLDAALRGCHTPDFYCLVEPDGSVLPCCLVEVAHQGQVGNLGDRSLTEIWHGAEYQQFRDQEGHRESTHAPAVEPSDLR
jgi:pyrroloquinoline quinone biosynthesis protein E